MDAPLPIVTFDLDGVLCRPPFGINPGGLRRPGRRHKPNPIVRFLLDTTERWRYGFRRPMPGAIAAFQAAHEFADCIVLTARGERARAVTERWFVEHLGSVPRIEMRADLAESSPEFKRRRARELGAAAHLEDDPNTAVLVADTIPVVLIDWRRNAGLDRERITRVSGLAEAVELLPSLLTEVRP
jgi:hypothetical protein